MEYRINGFNQIKAFYSLVFEQKHNIKPQHISLYIFLVNQNNRNKWVEWFKCPFDLAMAGACIGNKKTYYNCLSDLQEWKLIRYEKGVNEWKAPRIRLEVLNCTASETASVPQSEPLGIPLPIPLLTHIYKHITDNIYNNKQLKELRSVIDKQINKQEEGDGIKNTKEQFYKSELETAKEENNQYSKLYADCVKMIFGKNSSGLKLTGLLSIPNQLTFDQFTKLMKKSEAAKTNLPQMMLQLSNNRKYYSGKTSVYLTLNSWINKN